MARKKRTKIRIELRKNQQTRTRRGDLTRSYDEASWDDQDQLASGERISGKGDLTRKRTIIAESDADADPADPSSLISVDLENCLPGRVMTAGGLTSTVEAEDGRLFQCATRRLLKSLSGDGRQSVVTGDRVWFRPAGEDEGMIERIEPRSGVLSRASRGRQHVIVANVDQLLIVTSAAEPGVKPNLIDRFLISAEQGRIPAVIVINKIDLVDVGAMQPLVGVYSQMGYAVELVSAMTGQGIERLRYRLRGRESVVAGQSGVGKSSLLNAIDPELALRTRQVSTANQKGRHTTTAASLWRLTSGGYVVDTPGIRQFQLWDVVPEEVAGYFRDLRPFIKHCRFPNCTHTHEADCAVKDAVADSLLDPRRYESYLHLHAGDAV